MIPVARLMCKLKLTCYRGAQLDDTPRRPRVFWRGTQAAGWFEPAWRVGSRSSDLSGVHLAIVFLLFGSITINETGQAARNQVHDSLQRQVVSAHGKR